MGVQGLREKAVTRRGELPAEAVALDFQVKALVARRLQHLEEMAKGLPHERYLELVGRAKEVAWLIEEAKKRAKQLHGGSHDGED
jgi:hypothetical protein